MKHRSTVVCTLAVAILLAAPNVARQLEHTADELAQRAESVLWGALLSLHAQNFRAGVALAGNAPAAREVLAARRTNIKPEPRSDSARHFAARDMRKSTIASPQVQDAHEARAEQVVEEVLARTLIPHLPQALAAAIPVNGPGVPGVAGVKAAPLHVAASALLESPHLELHKQLRVEVRKLGDARRLLARLEKGKLSNEKGRSYNFTVIAPPAPHEKNVLKVLCPDAAGEAADDDSTSTQTNAGFNLDN